MTKLAETKTMRLYNICLRANVITTSVVKVLWMNENEWACMSKQATDTTYQSIMVVYAYLMDFL